MRTQQGVRRVTGWLLALVSVLVWLTAVALAEPDRQTIRMGFFAFDGYHEQSEDGVRSGYGYELLQHMAGYTDWRYEYVGYDRSWSDMQDMLANGEIDLLTSAQKTDERERRFDFCEEPVGTSAAILTVKAGDNRYMLEDYAHWSGMRVGMLKNNSRNGDFAILARERGFTYTPVYYDHLEEMVDQLKNGTEIDAVVTSNLRSIDDEWILAQFASAPFYIMVRKGNAALLSEIDRVLSLLFSEEPGLRTLLMNKYYSATSQGEIPYTQEERAFALGTRDAPLTAILNPDLAPYAYREDGELGGILYDLAQKIIARSGLNVQFMDVPNRSAYGEHLAAGDYDLRFDASYDYYQADVLDCRLTAAYLEAPISRLRQKGSGGAASAGFLENGGVLPLLQALPELQGREMQTYASTQALIDAVLAGKCDAGYLCSHAAELAVRREPTNRLVAEEVYSEPVRYAVAVSANQTPLLFSILHKAVASLGEEEKDEVYRKYDGYGEPPFSLIRYTYEYPMHVVLTVAAVFLVAGLTAVTVTVSRRRRQAAIRLKEEQARAEALSHALEAAERADIAKNHFLSTMSHEIRTPLNAVIGFNTIARNEITEAKTEEERRQADMRIMDYLAKSELASKHLLNIINDVLDMSAIESGKIKVAREQFDFKSMIGSLTALFFAQAKAKGVEFEVIFDRPTEEWFLGDQMRINQVLTNLLSNAVKFTPEGGSVKLWITQTETDEQTARFRFVVTDTGIGMTQEYLSHIWTPFEQAEASIARRFGGTGLGLSITKNLVDLMGGEIAVESASGKGSSFTVELPLGRMPQPAKSASYGFADIHALVVDDDVSTCEYIQLLFDRCGAKCETVTSGMLALERFQAAKERGKPFNVCLVDWRMPSMDGLETVRKIRSIADQATPIIIVTAYDFSEVAGEAEKAGVNMFVSKPLFQSSLFDLLVNISGKRAPKKVDKSTQYNFNGARVLLAEDNKMNMEVAKRILGSVGLTVDCAWNGREAVDMFAASRPGTYKAILMDVHMPEMDGYQATAEIRRSAHPEAKTMPIIAMTADAFAEDIAEAYESGMNDHVSKPIDMPKLFAVLEKHIISEL